MAPSSLSLRSRAAEAPALWSASIRYMLSIHAPSIHAHWPSDVKVDALRLSTLSLTAHIMPAARGVLAVPETEVAHEESA